MKAPGGGGPPAGGRKGGGGRPAVWVLVDWCVYVLLCRSVHTRKPKPRRREALPWPTHRRRTALRSEHGVRARLAFGGVGGGDGVDDRLGFFVADF